MAPTPPQLPSEASVVSSVDMDMDTEAAQQPPTSSAETKRVQIVTPSGGPPQTGQLGPERPPSFLAMGSFTMMNARKQSFYENHYNRRWDNFLNISFKSWEEIKWQAHLERSLFRHEWHWIVGILVAEYFNLVMHNLVYWIEGQVWKKTGVPPPLVDAGIMLFAGRLGDADWLPGLFLYFLIAMVLALCLGRQLLNNVPWGCPQVELYKRTPTATKSTNIPVPFVFLCKRACYALSIALVLRVITYMVTFVPNPAAYCHPPYFHPPNKWYVIMFRIEVTGSCGDLLFSSHTLHGMIMTLMVIRNAPNAYFVTGIAIFSMVMLPISLLAFKDHYSHDIVVAIYTCIMLWKLLEHVEPKNIDCDKYQIDFPQALQFGDTRERNHRRSVMVSRINP